MFWNFTGVVSLEIRNCHEGDSGNYRCMAQNIYGEESDYANLEVTGSEFESSASKREVSDFRMSLDIADAKSSLRYELDRILF